MKMLVKVVDNPNLVRDTTSNAILNTNNEALQAYKLRKKQANKVDVLEGRLDMIEQKVDRLISLLEKSL